MQKTAFIEKDVGETPLQALERFRKSDSNLIGVPMTYAGRLDPMASGKLLILIGDECKKRAEYDGLDKEYEFEVLLGISTDSGDVLGMPKICKYNSAEDERVIQVLNKVIGKHEFTYPVFSSKPVAGKPLFQHAHDKTIADIEMPTREAVVYSIVFEGSSTVAAQELKRNILKKINLLVAPVDPSIPGSDFRKKEICQKWNELGIEGMYQILTFNAVVGPGTYVRTLAPFIAHKLGTCGLAYSIHRSKIGAL